MHGKKLIVELFDRFIEAGGDYRYNIVKRFNELYEGDKNNPKSRLKKKIYTYYTCNKDEITLELLSDKNVCISITDKNNMYSIERSIIDKNPIFYKFLFNDIMNLRYIYGDDSILSRQTVEPFFGSTVYFNEFQDFSTAFRDFVFEELNIMKNI